MIDGKTKVFGIIGNPVSHSMSPVMHNAALQATAVNGVYVPFPVVDLEAAVRGIRTLGISGVSVTIPHKETIIKFLDDVDLVARKIGAVNTVVVSVREDGTHILKGFNTDWLGANRALAKHTDLKGKNVLVLGAGGSARAIGFGLIEIGAKVLLCSRTETRGRLLAGELGCEWFNLEDISGLDADIVVNATSVGMTPNTGVSLMDVDQLRGIQVVMDIVYSPLETQLLKNATKAGCATICGLEMLLYQGVEQFELWTGKTAPVDIMRAKLYELVLSV